MELAESIKSRIRKLEAKDKATRSQPRHTAEIKALKEKVKRLEVKK